MLREHVRHGAAAGLLAGLIFAALMLAVGNPLVAHADGLAHGDTAGQAGHAEEGAHAGGHAEHEAGGHGAGGEHGSAVPAAVTALLSLLGSALWGLLLGVVAFGLVYPIVEPALPGSAGVKSYVLGAAGFVTVSGAPWLALPPAPPGAEQALATETRLAVYAAMVAAGAVACGLALVVGRATADRHGDHVGAAAAAVPLVLLVPLAAAMPSNALHAALPDGLITAVTGFVVLGQIALWLVMADVHGRLRRRAHDAHPTDPRSQRPPHPAD